MGYCLQTLDVQLVAYRRFVMLRRSDGKNSEHRIHFEDVIFWKSAQRLSVCCILPNARAQVRLADARMENPRSMKAVGDSIKYLCDNW